jgi:hypothetical protein
MTAHEAPLTEVVEAIAQREGIEPTELPESISAIVDPEAVETVLQSGSATMRFEYLGYDVTVRHSDEITVELNSEALQYQTV